MNCPVLRIIGLMLLLLLLTSQAQALCVGPPIKHVFVGDTASDSSCSFNDIQSAIDDASTNPSCTSAIHVTREHTYTDQHLTISNRNVKLVAWGDGVTCTDIANQCEFFDCPFPPAATNPLVTLFGHDGDSVIHIDGASNVSLLNLSITGATLSSDQSGGGIYYDGTGSLSLTSTTVNLNHAGYGAGINMNGDGGPASLYLNAYSQILVNTADVSGGGIRMEGTSRLYALQPHTLIGFNHAPNGYGGGIEVLGPARADIGSPGYNGLGVIYDNDAQFGGGIAAVSPDHGLDVAIRLFTTDPANPVQVSNNRATSNGGAIYLKGLVVDLNSPPSGAEACAFDYRINDNIASDGAALYADWDSTIGSPDQGSAFLLNGAEACGPEPPTELGAVGCGAGVACNEISRNIAQDNSGSPTNGAAILMGNSGYFFADRLIMKGNVGGTLITGYSGGYYGSHLEMNNCLIASNQMQNAGAHLVDGQLLVYNCTLTGNTIDNGYLFFAEDGDNTSVRLIDDIFDEPGILTLDYPGDPARVTALYDLSNDVSTLGDGAGIALGAPTFVDAANGDYHLVPGSLGVDFAPSGGRYDLDRLPRTVDLPDVPNVFGPRDLGAYEIQHVFSCGSGDTIFCDGFDAP